MAVVATGEMTVNPDLSGFESKATGAFGNIAKKAAIAFGGIFAAQKGIEFFKGAIDGASDLQESMGKVSVVFGPASKEIEKFASNSAKAFGQSKQQALEAAGTFGNLAVSLGLPQAQAATMSKSLVTLGADLASFNNTSVDDALNALRSGLTGETEPLKRFGIALDDATLRQKALELGLVKTTKEVLPPAIKAQASYALIMDRSKTAQGDFARTSGGLANQQRILSAQITDLKTRIGTFLLPIVSKITGFLVNSMIPAFDKLGATVGPIIKGVVQAVNVLFKGDFTGGGPFAEDSPFISSLFDLRDKYLPIIQQFAAFIKDNLKPILIGLAAAVLVLAGPFVALGAAFVVAYAKSETFRDIINQVVTQVTALIGGLIEYVVTNFPKFQEAILHVVNAVVGIFNTVLPIIIPIVEGVIATVSAVIKTVVEVIKQVVLFVTNIINGDFAAAFGNLKNIVFTVVGGIIDILKGIVPAILKAGVAAVKAIIGLGVDMMAGLAEGVIKGAGKVLAAIKKYVLDKVPGFVKKFFGIDSPSKMFAGFGANLMEGMAVGIRGAASSPADALARAQSALGVGGRVGVALNSTTTSSGTLPGTTATPSPLVGQIIIQAAAAAEQTAYAIVRELKAEQYRQGK